MSSTPSCKHSSVRPFCFFFNDTASTEIYTLSLHDALPILSYDVSKIGRAQDRELEFALEEALGLASRDRKSTRLNSSHVRISYAVFCLKKKREHSESHSRPRRAPVATRGQTPVRRAIRAAC